jgi:WD40 repeat protein
MNGLRRASVHFLLRLHRLFAHGQVEDATVRVERGSPDEVGRGLAISPDGKRILVGYDRAHLLRLLDLETGKELHRFPLASNPRGLSISPDGRLAACGSLRGLVYLQRLPGTFPVERTPAP